LVFLFIFIFIFPCIHKKFQLISYYSIEIEYNGKLYILQTTATTLVELESDIRSKFRLQENIKFDLEFLRNGRYFVLENMGHLKEGMTIKVSIFPVSIQPQQNVRIHGKFY